MFKSFIVYKKKDTNSNNDHNIIKFLITKRTIMRTRKVVTNMIMITVIKRLRTRILEKK